MEEELLDSPWNSPIHLLVRLTVKISPVPGRGSPWCCPLILRLHSGTLPFCGAYLLRCPRKRGECCGVANSPAEGHFEVTLWVLRPVLSPCSAPRRFLRRLPARKAAVCSAISLDLLPVTFGSTCSAEYAGTSVDLLKEKKISQNVCVKLAVF